MNTYGQQQQTQQPAPPQGWGYMPTQQQFNFGYGYPQGYVQPHINPRFASQFGINLNMGYMQQAQQQQYAYGAEYALPSSAGGGGTATGWHQESWQSEENRRDGSAS